MAIKVTECLSKVKSDEEDLDIEVDLRESKAGEECSWQYSATFPGCEKQNRNSFKSFFNTIGLFSKQDWDEWILVSQMLGLSFSPGGQKDDLEIAMSTNVDGKVKVTCIGTSTGEQPLLESHDIFEEGDFPGNKSTDSDSSNTIDNTIEIDELAPEDYPVEDGADDAQQLESKKSPAMLSCPLCDEIGYKDAWFLRRHIQRMHLVPIRCEICRAVFIDKYCYMKHSKNCFFFCSVEGCSFFDKRKTRLDGHMRTHERDS